MEKKKDKKVLVLGVDDRSALAVTRSLGRKGIIVHVGSDVPSSICKYSRYAHNTITFPSASKEPDIWVQTLREQMSIYHYDLVIPTADSYLVPMVRNRFKLESNAKLAIPDDYGFIFTYRKDKTLELAQKLGVPCPKTAKIDNIQNIDDKLNDFDFPVVIKPVSSKIWQNSTRYNLRVETARSRGELKTILTRILPICPALLQSLHYGVGVGQEFLMRKGELVAAFQHERIHEPRKGGGSSYRKSVDLDSELLKFSLRMLKELEWTGVAMVEYKYDKKKKRGVLMEINGRFWGSLPLAIASGIDFPAWLYDMVVQNKLPERVNYKRGIYCRNITRDLDWLKERLKLSLSNPKSLLNLIYNTLIEVRGIVTLNERFDTLVLDDLKPGMVHIARYLKNNINSALEKLIKICIKLNYELNMIYIWNCRRKIKNSLKSNLTINFICKGNICRSPFAERYLRLLLEEKHITDTGIVSTGLLKKEHRRSPGVAISAAESFGIDLTDHRSKVLSLKDIVRAGILLVMDIDLYRKVLALYPAARKKTYFLGILQKGYPKRIEIADPEGQNVDYFQNVYRQISQSLEEMTRIVKGIVKI